MIHTQRRVSLKCRSERLASVFSEVFYINDNREAVVIVGVRIHLAQFSIEEIFLLMSSNVDQVGTVNVRLKNWDNFVVGHIAGGVIQAVHFTRYILRLLLISSR